MPSFWTGVSEQDLIWNFLRTLFGGEKTYKNSMPCGSAAGEAGILCVCALKYMAGISEPAINYPFANENSPSLWCRFLWCPRSGTSACPGLGCGEGNAAQGSTALPHLSARMCWVIIKWGKTYNSNAGVDLLLFSASLGCFPAEGTRHPPSARQRSSCIPSSIHPPAKQETWR